MCHKVKGQTTLVIHLGRYCLLSTYLEILTILCQLEYLLRSWPTLTLLYSSRWLGGGSQSSISKLFFVLLYYVLFFFSFSFLFSDILNCYIIGKKNNKNSFTYAKQCILNIKMFFKTTLKFTFYKNVKFQFVFVNEVK